jgi:hypothetical protein
MRLPVETHKDRFRMEPDSIGIQNPLLNHMHQIQDVLSGSIAPVHERQGVFAGYAGAPASVSFMKSGIQ